MGGGHAHCGAMIYLGENWPDQYRNTFFTINIHGHRVNNDLLEPEGSGYVGKHGHDFLRVNDTWFRGVALVPSHDGGMYVSDWSDAGECHDYDDIHRENGRIYKITYNGAHKGMPDFRKFRDNNLINFQTAKDEWMVNKSRLILQERAEQHNLQPTTAGRLRELFKNGFNLHERLRALWALHAIGESGTVIDAALIDPEEYIRGWAVQLALENGTRSESTARAVAELPNLARNDPSPIVRLFLASALQKIPAEACAKVGAGLASHAEDASDHNLPLMIWYGIEPVVSADEKVALDLLKAARIPILRRFIAQRLALKMQLGGIVSLLADGTDETNGVAADIVNGMFEALHGRRQLTAPENWDEALARLRKNPEKEVRQKALSLAVTFSDEKVLARLKDEASDKGLPAEDRREALEAVTQTRDSGMVPWLQKNVSDPAVRDSSIKALAAYDDPNTPKLLVSAYPELSREEKSDAINTLASRASYALPLLQAVEQKRIPAKDVTPFFVRQMRAYKDPAIHKLLNQLGTVRDVAPDKAAQIAKYKALLTPDALRIADLEKGRAVFQHTCASCHTLFDEGGKLAPELTGAQRSNLDYILENVVDPSAVVPDRYKAAYFETSDDRLISGIVQQENESTVTIQTQAGPITLPRADVVKQTQSNVSLMPEGLLASLSEDEIVNLVAYLQSPHQVPAAPQHTTDNH
jgi:putative heme-binding domain-containing protein